MKDKKIQDLLENIKEHVVMKDHTTWKVGGVADYFVEVKTVEDLIKSVRISHQLNIPYVVIGNGSNILFSDYGFPGIVIKNSTNNIAVLRERSQVIADSGAFLSQVILKATASELTGLEFLFGVPGTIGGALYGNAGAYGSSLGDYVKNVTMLLTQNDGEVPKIEQISSEWLSFSYRSSKLKKLKSRTKPIVLSVRLQLAHNQRDDIVRKINYFRLQREKSQPIGSNSGCIFKNPIPQEIVNVTGKGSKGMPELPIERRAGYLLEKSGAKKLKVGDAQVSSKHANFIINNANAKASEIRTLIEQMRELVRAKYDIILQEEIEYIGQW